MQLMHRLQGLMLYHWILAFDSLLFRGTWMKCLKCK